MPYINIHVHAVWTTYQRKPFLKQEIRNAIFQHIKDNAILKEIRINIINGYLEHVHCLISMNAGQCIADIMQLIKGESSFWINKEKLTGSRFSWQDEYWAVSVDESQIKRVREYILNQEVHHRKKSSNEEFNEFIEKYKLDM